MARRIRELKDQDLDFSSESYSVLINDFSRCARANWALTPDQRATALVLLKYKDSETSLFELITAAKK